MWISISGFNYEHQYQSKVILALLVMGESGMCCGSKGKSSLLSCLLFLDLLFFLFHLLGHLRFLGVPHFQGCLLVFNLGIIVIFGVVFNFLAFFFFLACCQFEGQNSAKRGQAGSCRAIHSHTQSYIFIHSYAQSYIVIYSHTQSYIVIHNTQP